MADLEFIAWCKRFGFDGNVWVPPLHYQNGAAIQPEQLVALAESCRKHNRKRERYQLAFWARVPPESGAAHTLARAAGIPTEWEEL